jgi:hypothetical protein
MRHFIIGASSTYLRLLSEFDFRYNARHVSGDARAILGVKSFEGNRQGYRHFSDSMV